MERISVLLVDDHDILMDGIESILKDASIIVAGKADSATSAELMIPELKPHLVLTDISMGEISGIEFTRTITEKWPLTRVIILTMHDDPQYIDACIKAGAAGYLLKNVKQEELFEAIRTVMAGEQYIQRSLVGSYTRAIQKKREAEEKSPLSPREIEIIRLIAEDLTSNEISKRLFLSEHTIDTHRKNIARKTGTRSVLALVKYARDNNLL